MRRGVVILLGQCGQTECAGRWGGHGHDWKPPGAEGTEIEGTFIYLDNVQSDGRAVLVACVNVPFEVHIEELEDKVELLICVYNVEEPSRSSRQDGYERLVDQCCRARQESGPENAGQRREP